MISFCTRLLHLYLAGNPVSSNRRMRETLVLKSESLESINGKAIPSVERMFLRNRESVRLRPKKKPQLIERIMEEKDVIIPHLPPYATQYRYF
jgi:hypothetical protein